MQIMPSPQSPPDETEATAESALLVLADTLTWEPVLGAEERYTAETDQGTYETRLRTLPLSGETYWQYWHRPPQNGAQADCGYADTLDAAKRACARHHATGEWE